MSEENPHLEANEHFEFQSFTWGVFEGTKTLPFSTS
jgi:hypothetical protein